MKPSVVFLAAFALLLASCSGSHETSDNAAPSSALPITTPGTSPTGASVPAGVLFFDDFEYDVTREATNKFAPSGPFVAHGWFGGKDAVNNGPGAGGWIYTTSTIPGYSGTLPGVNSTRALVLEAKAATYAGSVSGAWRQTDFYLRYGDTDAGSLDTVPPDVWFQHWIYIADSPTQPSLFPPETRLGKWIYPTRNAYPSTNLEWLINMSGKLEDSEVVSSGSSLEIDIGQKIWPRI